MALFAEAADNLVHIGRKINDQREAVGPGSVVGVSVALVKIIERLQIFRNVFVIVPIQDFALKIMR